jgi:hypothetical protein
MGEIILTEEQQRLNAYHSWTRELRAQQYPDIQDQLDMIWNDMDTGALEGKDSTYYNAILAVKQQFVKPE